jgi:2-C-methyl-D-erythritol 4-phosphate cytidylyltransferase
MAIQAHKVWGLIIASGKSEQLTTETDTAFLSLGDKPMLAYSLQAMEDCDEIDGVAVVVPRERMEMCKSLSQLFGFTKLRKIVGSAGGRASVLQAGMKVLDDDVTLVVVQSVSFPFVRPSLISETVRVAKRYGCGVAAERLTGCVKTSARGSKVSDTLPAGGIWMAQSPQTFRREFMEPMLQQFREGVQDEAEALEKLGKEVRLVPGPKWNIKIAAAEDLSLAGALQRMELNRGN